MVRRSVLGLGIAALVVAAASAEAENSSPFERLAVRVGSLVEASSNVAVNHGVLASQLTEESTEESTESTNAGQALAEERAKNEALKAVVDADNAKLAETRAQLIAAQQAVVGGPAVQQQQQAAAPDTNAQQAELESIRAQAEQQAAETIRAATAEAREIINKAKAASEDCGANCGARAAKKDEEWRDVVLLTPTSAAGQINDQALGLAPVMTVDTPTIRHAGVVLKKFESFHDKFIDQHERDCATGVCPDKLNFRVGE